MKKFGEILLLGILCVSILCKGATVSEAAPAEIGSKTYYQPSGERFEAQLSGDEYLNYVLANETGDLIELGEDDYWYHSILDETTMQAIASKQRYLIDKKPKNALTYKDISKLKRVSESVPDQKAVTLNSKWSKEQPLLVVLVEFNDQSLTYTEEDWSNRIFSKTEKSLYTYYKEATNDAIHISAAKENYGVNDGIVRVKLNQNHPNPGSTFDLARPALKAAVENLQEFVDFNVYDTNGNGIIEQNELHIMGIFAGYENSSVSYSPKVWGHKGSYQGRPIGYPVVNGIKINNYTLFGETMLNKRTNIEYQSELGLIAHEFGHDLRLPDLYNSERTIIQQDGKFIEVADGDGLGMYSLMASGSWTSLPGENPGATPPHLDAYCKVALGIVTPQVITHPQTVDVKSIHETGFNIFRVNSNDPKEYFLVENRQLVGMDESLQTITYSSEHGSKPIVASGGIGIYHVNERYTKNVSTKHQLVTLKEADEGILGYSKLKKPRYYASNNYDGFYYVGAGAHGKQQQKILSQTTTPSTEISDGSYPEYSIVINSESSKSMSVTFNAKPVLVESVAVEPESVTLETGSTKILNAKIQPENADDKLVQWNSLNEEIVHVSDTGKVTAKKAGTAIITVTTQDGKKTASSTIYVKDPVIPVTGVGVDSVNKELTIGSEYQLKTTITPANATNKEVFWDSTDSKVASVSSTGLVTAKTVGETTITVTTVDGSKSAKIVIKVSEKDDHGNEPEGATKIELNKEYSGTIDYSTDIDYFYGEIPVGQRVAIISDKKIDNVEQQSVKDDKWSSLFIAQNKVEENGKFYTINQGYSIKDYKDVRIRFRGTKGEKYSFKVVPFNPKAVTVDQKEVSMNVGETVQLNAKANNGLTEKLIYQKTWGVNESLTVDSIGKVKALEPGIWYLDIADALTWSNVRVKFDVK